jgi:hypothetical protein
MKYFALAAALVAFSAPAFACGDKSASNDVRQKVAVNSSVPSSYGTQTPAKNSQHNSGSVQTRQPQR